MPMAAEGPIYCVWEAKEGISDSEFQDFINGPDGVNWGLVALNNNVMKLDLALTGGQTPYESKFLNLIIKKQRRGVYKVASLPSWRLPVLIKDFIHLLRIL